MAANAPRVQGGEMDRAASAHSKLQLPCQGSKGFRTSFHHVEVHARSGVLSRGDVVTDKRVLTGDSL